MLNNTPLSDLFAWADPWLAPLFTAWGVPVSQLEVWAFMLSLAMVLFNLRVNPWGWPLAIVSSLLYGVLFARSKLYGEATLQLVFVALSCWGWWQWLWGRDESNASLRPQALGRRGRQWALAVTLLMWPVLGLLLDHATDSDVPYLDALPTAASLLGQWLLGRKYIENWSTWLVVNLVSMVLFGQKGLWLTVILYGLFAVLSVAGWQQWRRHVVPVPQRG
ncbi:MAG: nicotinamide riboside transporter PnuC [Aquabacterium sp.]|uniref:nicotinamide riboside transporter PnuC n=1 Tax=Aquabacterium sp. TaxID=1872578 RepID=UPI0027241190|nr:nicotinamide riboside transporter PnuC [Aquabacterium sp.]MDO9005191.1 nicotinamide riboside transporter PnuC [Aquabacterium sp.]